MWPIIIQWRLLIVVSLVCLPCFVLCFALLRSARCIFYSFSHKFYWFHTHNRKWMLATLTKTKRINDTEAFKCEINGSKQHRKNMPTKYNQGKWATNVLTCMNELNWIGVEGRKSVSLEVATAQSQFFSVDVFGYASLKSSNNRLGVHIYSTQLNSTRACITTMTEILL